MKTNVRMTALTLGAMLMAMSGMVMAQGRGRGHEEHGKPQHHYEHSDRRYSDDHHHDNNRPVVREYHHHGDHYVRHDHGHVHPWMEHHHPHARTRYVYFRDYDVYYDYDRNVYMSWSGRNWSFTVDMPVMMRRVAPQQIVYVDVDYDRDDLQVYHARHPRHDSWAYCSR